MGESISSSSKTCSTDDAFHSTNYSEDVDSGWTAYFLLAFHDEEAASVVVPTPCLPADGDVRGSAFTVSAGVNNKHDKENNKVIKLKGEPITMVPKKEEDPLEDTASSPPLRPNGAQDVWNNTPSGREKRSTTIVRDK